MSPYLSRFSGLALSAALGGGTLAGCALSTRNATLIYPPETAQSAVPVAQATTSPVPQSIAIAVLPFVDRRDDTTKVGNVRNALGMKLAPIRTVNSVPVWVRNALALELTNAGYDADTSAAFPDSSLAIGGDVLKVHADAYFTYGGEVDLLVHLTKGGRELIRHRYVGHGSGGVSWSATAKSYAQALALALADALRQVVADVTMAKVSE